ncbi:helix-turn-helix domain-containing protein [Streptomyces sp. NBC_01220]|uniref:helix-turn-helix domain-containing protein n=1 Tax=Streptomyces sp. NBC_01220 TaxID=2903781 RepID=UPI00352C7377
MTTGHPGHPGREEFKKLRARGVPRREAAQQVGVNPRTAKDWDNGVLRTGNTRVYPDGQRVNYTTGTVTMSGVIIKAPVGLKSLEKKLHPRFLSLSERERIRDLHAAGQSLRAIGRALGRPASTVSRELRSNSGTAGYHPYAAHWAAATRRSRRAVDGHVQHTSCGKHHDLRGSPKSGWRKLRHRPPQLQRVWRRVRPVRTAAWTPVSVPLAPVRTRAVRNHQRSINDNLLINSQKDYRLSAPATREELHEGPALSQPAPL